MQGNNSKLRVKGEARHTFPSYYGHAIAKFNQALAPFPPSIIMLQKNASLSRSPYLSPPVDEEDHGHRPQHEDGPHDGGLLRAHQPGVEVRRGREGAGRGAATVAGGRRGLVRVKLEGEK